MSVLRTIAIMLGVLVFWIIMSFFGRREANFYLMVVAAIVLPVLYWMRRPLTWPALIFSAVAIAITLSPIDLVVQQTGKSEIAVMPAYFGRGCDRSAAACYGDVLHRNDPRYALVISP
jgi:hypothetical protein